MYIPAFAQSWLCGVGLSLLNLVHVDVRKALGPSLFWLRLRFPLGTGLGSLCLRGGQVAGGRPSFFFLSSALSKEQASTRLRSWHKRFPSPNACPKRVRRFDSVPPRPSGLTVCPVCREDLDPLPALVFPLLVLSCSPG